MVFSNPVYVEVVPSKINAVIIFILIWQFLSAVRLPPVGMTRLRPSLVLSTIIAVSGNYACSHSDSTGRAFDKRLRDFGYPAGATAAAGENIAWVIMEGLPQLNRHSMHGGTARVTTPTCSKIPSLR
jgi:hypothetical protein